MSKILFLPGAVGSADFWQPVAQKLNSPHEMLCWPGLGNERADPQINSLDDLVTLVSNKCDEKVCLVAQSMGGYIAIKAALKKPEAISRLVLVVTSGGVNMTDLGGSNWREDYRKAYPKAARWIEEPVPDLSEALKQLHHPTLLIWGDQDPISPVRVGERLQGLLPNATLEVIKGADHDLAREHSQTVAEMITKHLQHNLKAML